MKKIILLFLLLLIYLKTGSTFQFQKIDNIKESIRTVTNIIEITKNENALTLPIFSPVKTKNIIEITDIYRRRLKHPITKKPSFHNGIDFSVFIGTEVYSTANGTITEAGWIGGYGRQILIEHQNNYSTRYGHLSKILVKVGENVKKGQLIGLSGNSGITTGPHLHYELILYTSTIDPMLFYFEWPREENKKHYLEILKKLEDFPFQIGPENNL